MVGGGPGNVADGEGVAEDEGADEGADEGTERSTEAGSEAGGDDDEFAKLVRARKREISMPDQSDEVRSELMRPVVVGELGP
jgi:hypothetical protein